MSAPLRREGAAPPVRIVHLGLGSFFRAHQVWYTANAPDADQWGVAAFAGRSRALADALDAQGGAYTLLTRAADGDRFDVVGSVVRAHAADDHDAWLGYLADPAVAVVTVTVTEAGYRQGGYRQGGADDGSPAGLDATDPDVTADVDALRADPRSPVTTAPGRLVAGFLARRAAGAGPLAVVPCDNLMHNGPVAARVVGDLAALVDPTLAAWVEANVSFVTTVVDRITPRTTDDDVDTVTAGTGRHDAVPVVTEPFSEWVLAGSFPAGRPRWEDAGATFTDDVTAYEQRKLWLLNGAHSLLAYAGPGRGHTTVADAVQDPVCRRWVEQWWDEACPHLPHPDAELAAYRAALLDRFANPRIRHLLGQVAADGSQKLPVRILPVLRAERASGRLPAGAVRVLAAWVLHLRGDASAVTDPRAEELRQAADGDVGDAARRVLAALDPQLAGDDALVTAVADTVRDLADGTAT
ncbi:mannitol dehydrogenase family protein [Thalassiella azotivora]